MDFIIILLMLSVIAQFLSLVMIIAFLIKLK